MQIEAFLICDAATDSNGKLNILGAFDTIHATKFPAVHLQSAIVARVRFEPHDYGTREITITMFDTKGRLLLPPFNNTHAIKQSTTPQRLNLILSLPPIHLERGGEYTVILNIDGKDISRLPFAVQIEPPK